MTEVKKAGWASKIELGPLRSSKSEITKISDVLKGTDVFEGTINGAGEDEWISSLLLIRLGV